MLMKPGVFMKVAPLLLLGAMLVIPCAFAGDTGVYVNGVELNAQQLAMVYRATGQMPAPGHYVVQNGCVAHFESGQVVCRQAPQNGSYYGGVGRGYGYSGGAGQPWFYRGSDYSGGYSVGGDGSGCVYTADWSNC
jgi:hypothetical protein